MECWRNILALAQTRALHCPWTGPGTLLSFQHAKIATFSFFPHPVNSHMYSRTSFSRRSLSVPPHSIVDFRTACLPEPVCTMHVRRRKCKLTRGRESAEHTYPLQLFRVEALVLTIFMSFTRNRVDLAIHQQDVTQSSNVSCPNGADGFWSLIQRTRRSFITEQSKSQHPSRIHAPQARMPISTGFIDRDPWRENTHAETFSIATAQTAAAATIWRRWRLLERQADGRDDTFHISWVFTSCPGCLPAEQPAATSWVLHRPWRSSSSSFR